jgi:hypothetical protein
MTVRIAMWSGPRNISTALMRSWENRPDCSVVDEPFYACYLSETGLEHPCREEILQDQSCDRQRVISHLCEYDPGTPLYYQKLMTHHMPRGMDMNWCANLRHCFLIRDPGYIIASYLQKMPSVSVDDIGIVRQLELFREITEITGVRPAVIDSDDVLRNPDSVLSQVCAALGVRFLAREMTHWPAGKRDSDGVWAGHWYHSVEESTGFMPWQERAVKLEPEHRALAEEMQVYYQQLADYRIKP